LTEARSLIEPSAFTIRAATLADVETLAEQRRAMFSELGFRDDQALDAMASAFAIWVRQKMQAGEYLAWLAAGADGTIAAGAGLWLMDWPPHMIGPGSRRGNVLNVYTRPDQRRQGLARRLMEVVLDSCRTLGIRTIILHASEAGRPLYEALGFEPTNEMRLLIDAGK